MYVVRNSRQLETPLQFRFTHSLKYSHSSRHIPIFARHVVWSQTAGWSVWNALHNSVPDYSIVWAIWTTPMGWELPYTRSSSSGTHGPIFKKNARSIRSSTSPHKQIFASVGLKGVCLRMREVVIVKRLFFRFHAHRYRSALRWIAVNGSNDEFWCHSHFLYGFV